MRVHLLALAALALLWPGPAAAHQTLHEVQRGKAIAVRASYAGGEPLGDAACEIYSPADAQVPYQRGRTDRRGWVAFVPDAPGIWRVKVVDPTGHGVDVEVLAGTSAATGGAPDAGAWSDAPFLLRALAGLGAIGAAFGGLFLLYRRKAGG